MNRPYALPDSNHFASNDFSFLIDEYRYLWSTAEIGEKWVDEAKNFSRSAIVSCARYKTVAKAIGCPWYFVAVIHYREASCNWNSNIANGDPWNKITVHVPEGRGPFVSWEAAAIDALTLEDYAGKSDWSLPRLLWRLEGYNGWGYRINGQHEFVCHKDGDRPGTFDGTYKGSMQDTTPRNASPYVFNGTQFYEKGVSIEDHSFYPNAVDDQPGVLVLLKALELADVSIA